MSLRVLELVLASLRLGVGAEEILSMSRIERLRARPRSWRGSLSSVVVVVEIKQQPYLAHTAKAFAIVKLSTPNTRPMMRVKKPASLLFKSQVATTDKRSSTNHSCLTKLLH
jgi:hypothetical protein